MKQKNEGQSLIGIKKKWFIPPGVEIAHFTKWLPKTVAPTMEQIDQTENFYKNSFKLNDLLLNIQKTLAEQHSTPYWVRAEVASLSTNVHTYFELIDHDSEGMKWQKFVPRCGIIGRSPYLNGFKNKINWFKPVIKLNC